MKHLNTYKLFESNDNDLDDIKSNVADLLRDSVTDKYINLKIKVGDFTNTDNQYVKAINISIGDEFGNVDIKVNNIKDDIKRTIDYLESEGFRNFTFHFKYKSNIHNSFEPVAGTINYGNKIERLIDSDFSNYFVFKLNIFMEKPDEGPYNQFRHVESIKVPIELGDTILGGRFKNKKTLVKKIGKNKKGDITINDKPLLKYRILKEDIDIDYYLGHLEGDDFRIESTTKDSVYTIQNTYNTLRIYKPINESKEYKYSNCKGFKWLDLEDDLLRFIDEVGVDNILSVYIIHKSWLPRTTTFTPAINGYERMALNLESIFNKSPFDGDIVSITLIYR